jgi:ATP-binding cassette subfamily F protein 3
MACLALQNANLLLLDEPTNHLDLPSQEVLQNVLADFAGTILLVSHDRYLIDALATQIWEVVPGDSKLHVFEGTYSEYRASKLMTATAVEQKAQLSRAAVQKKEKPVLSKDQQRRVRQQIERLEDEIDLLEQHLKALGVELENPPADPVKVQRLGEDYARVQADLDERIEEWTKLGEGY